MVWLLSEICLFTLSFPTGEEMISRPINKISALILFVIVGVFLSLGSIANEINLVTNEDKVVAKTIIMLSKKKKWIEYKKLLIQIQNPILKKALLWYQIKSPNSGVEFDQITEFLIANPDWPQRKLLQMRAEEVFPLNKKHLDIINWFEDRIPLTPNGATSLANSYIRFGNITAAKELIERIWIFGNFGAKQETQFYKQFRRFMTRKNHIDRLDRLLWEGKYFPVRRMYRRINSDYRALAEARLSLRRMSGGVDQAIERVPQYLQKDTGLIYERLRWRRKKGKNTFAQELLKSPPEALVRPLRWWREREILARRALAEGDISIAYKLIKNHGLEKYHPSGYVEAEWLAGWIALRFLKDKDVSFQHFKAAYSAANFPISKSRCAYWLGRAAESEGKMALARYWYEVALRHQITFYGQLAADRLDKKRKFNIFEFDYKNKDPINSFERNELVLAVRVLGKAGISEILGPFIHRLNKLSGTRGSRFKVARLARESGRLDLAVSTAKLSFQEGLGLTKEGYPILQLKLNLNKESSFIHAIVRQESAFNSRALSPAGARGLMQLMPTTAARIAKNNSLPYSRRNLINDKSYNLKLGQLYIKKLLGMYNNSYVLTLAAYNAGPSRVKRWLRIHGDPRDQDVDSIDWIEKIPFSETRNYIQRVMESLHVYRELLMVAKFPFKPESELQK